MGLTKKLLGQINNLALFSDKKMSKISAKATNDYVVIILQCFAAVVGFGPYYNVVGGEKSHSFSLEIIKLKKSSNKILNPKILTVTNLKNPDSRKNWKKSENI